MTKEFVPVTTEREQRSDMRLRIFAALSGARKGGGLVRSPLRYVADFYGPLRTIGGNSPAKNAGHPWAVASGNSQPLLIVPANIVSEINSE